MTDLAVSSKSRIFTAVSLIMVVQLLAGCSSGSVGKAAPTINPAAPAVDASQYQIGPGDHLQVFVYESPTLSVSDLPVRPDGRISLPLVPDLVAAGRTPSELSAEISSRLKSYIKDPNVSVIVRSFVGTFDRQIRVIGEATEPLALPYSDRMTVLDVMIAAKGLTKFASGNNAVIVRRTATSQETLKVRLSDLLKDGDISQNVAMQPGDTLIIPQTWF